MRILGVDLRRVYGVTAEWKQLGGLAARHASSIGGSHRGCRGRHLYQERKTGAFTSTRSLNSKGVFRNVRAYVKAVTRSGG